MCKVYIEYPSDRMVPSRLSSPSLGVQFDCRYFAFSSLGVSGEQFLTLDRLSQSLRTRSGSEKKCHSLGFMNKKFIYAPSVKAFQWFSFRVMLCAGLPIFCSLWMQ